MKTSELQGPALDWAVALIEYPEAKEQGYLEVFPHDLSFDDGTTYSPSTDWSQGGPIIEREQITIGTDGEGWCAGKPWDSEWMSGFVHRGQTPLIAAMRCYVASKLGDEVEVPTELITEEV